MVVTEASGQNFLSDHDERHSECSQGVCKREHEDEWQTVWVIASVGSATLCIFLDNCGQLVPGGILSAPQHGSCFRRNCLGTHRGRKTQCWVFLNMSDYSEETSTWLAHYGAEPWQPIWFWPVCMRNSWNTVLFFVCCWNLKKNTEYWIYNSPTPQRMVSIKLNNQD